MQEATTKKLHFKKNGAVDKYKVCGWIRFIATTVKVAFEKTFDEI